MLTVPVIRQNHLDARRGRLFGAGRASDNRAGAGLRHFQRRRVGAGRLLASWVLLALATVGAKAQVDRAQVDRGPLDEGPGRTLLVRAVAAERTGSFQASAPLSFGVPFARGTVTDADRLRIWRRDNAAPLPAQARVLSRWPDQSVRWALMDTTLAFQSRESVPLGVGFAPDIAASVDRWRVGREQDASDRVASLRVVDGSGADWEVVGPVREEQPGPSVLGLAAILVDRFGDRWTGVLDQDGVQVIERGPVRLCVAVRGRHVGLDIPAEREQRPPHYYTFTAWVHLVAGHPTARVEWSLENMPLHDPVGRLAFRSYELGLPAPGAVDGVDLPTGRETGNLAFELDQDGLAKGAWNATVDGESRTTWRSNGPSDLWAGLLTGAEFPRSSFGAHGPWVVLHGSAQNHPSALSWQPGAPLSIGLLPERANNEHWLDDATRKTFRLSLVPDADLAGRALVQLAADPPFVALVPRDVADSRAWGDTGLITVPDPSETKVGVKRPKSTGGWSDWGEFRTKNTHQSGSPRNQLSVYLEAIQARNQERRELADARAHHAMDLRPYHLRGFSADEFPKANLFEGLPHVNEPPERRLGRTGLDQRHLPYKQGLPSRGHGYTGFDPEHMTLDDVYEYYLLTGSWPALDALHSAGEAMLTWHYVRPEYWLHTSRTIGWTLRALVQCFRATGDRRYLDACTQMVRRADEERGQGDVKYLRRNPKDRRHIAESESEAPWMVAVAMHGLCAYWMETEDPRVPPMLRDLTTFVMSAYRGRGFVSAMPVDDPEYRGEVYQPMGTSQWIPGALGAAAFITGDHMPVDLVLPYYSQMVGHSSGPVAFGSETWHWWQPYLVSLETRHGPAVVRHPGGFLAEKARER